MLSVILVDVLAMDAVHVFCCLTAGLQGRFQRSRSKSRARRWRGYWRRFFRRNSARLMKSTILLALSACAPMDLFRIFRPDLHPDAGRPGSATENGEASSSIARPFRFSNFGYRRPRCHSPRLMVTVLARTRV